MNLSNDTKDRVKKRLSNDSKKTGGETIIGNKFQ